MLSQSAKSGKLRLFISHAFICEPAGKVFFFFFLHKCFRSNVVRLAKKHTRLTKPIYCLGWSIPQNHKLIKKTVGARSIGEIWLLLAFLNTVPVPTCTHQYLLVLRICVSPRANFFHPEQLINSSASFQNTNEEVEAFFPCQSQRGGFSDSVISCSNHHSTYYIGA